MKEFRDIVLDNGKIIKVHSTVEFFSNPNKKDKITTLKEAKFYPEIGDIVDWNGYYFEMNSVTEPQLVAGHQSFKHSIIVKAHRSRLSGLQIEERTR